MTTAEWRLQDIKERRRWTYTELALFLRRRDHASLSELEDIYGLSRLRIKAIERLAHRLARLGRLPLEEAP